MKRIDTYIIGCLIFTMSACSFSKNEVDLIVHNAVVRTAEPGAPQAEAFAVKDGRIIEIGPERRILNRYRAIETLDAKKAFVYPGLIDAHCHFLGYGLNLSQADLSGSTSPEEVIQRLVKHTNQYPSEWVLGRGWDQNRFDVPEYPSKELLDSVFPDVPVYIVRVDGHAALVNSEALRRAGIRQWQEVEGGEMIRVGNEPTGMLIDKAMELVQEVIPPASKSERIRALREAEKDCLKYGLTSVGDAGLSKNDVALIDSLQSIGELHIQVYAMLSATDENFEHYLANGPTQTDRLTVRSFKFYADGALGSRGACLLQPYADRLDSQHRGFMLTDIDELETIALALKEAGFQMNTHCIGDSANRAVLDLYGRVLESSNDLRWRIEHAQVVHAQDLPKFNEFTIIPSVQPVHATSDMPWAELRLGRNRIRRAYAYADLLKQNGLLALGTDFPVEAISPFQTWYAAVERKSVDGEPKEGFFFNQRLSPEQTLLGMTLWAAIAQFEEHHKGSLAEGKWADFIIIDRDLLNASPSAVLETKVLETRIHGERVYRYE